jgi:hypothetical protein
MSDKIEIKIGGKAYRFTPRKRRRINGVYVTVRPNACVIDSPVRYVFREGDTPQDAFDEALKSLHKYVQEDLRWRRGAEGRLVRESKSRLAFLVKKIKQEKVDVKRAVARTRATLARTEEKAAISLAFGRKK